MRYMEHWPRYILRLIIASYGTNVPGMKFLHQIVFQLLGKITDNEIKIKLSHTDQHVDIHLYFYVNQRVTWKLKPRYDISLSNSNLGMTFLYQIVFEI